MLSFTEFWVVVVCYIVFILGIGAYTDWKNSKKEGGTQLFSSKLNWPQAIMTYIASLMSVWLFFAGPAGYYKGGFVYWQSEIVYLPMYMLLAHFVANKIWALSRKRDFVTPADFYCDRFQGKGNKILRLLVALVFLISAFPYVTSVISAIAQGAIRVSGGRINYAAVCLILGLAMVTFTTIGGFKSVALTDTIQGIVYMIAIWAIAFIALWYGFGGSLTDCVKSLMENSGGAYFSYPGPRGWVPYGYRFGYPFALLIGYSIMLPHIFVRACYSGRDLNTQRKLALHTPWIRAVVWTGCFVVGIVCFGMLPNIADADAEYIIPYLIEGSIFPSNPLLAHVMMIVFFCGACGVGLSTADSYLLSAASIVTDDILVDLCGLKLTSKKKTQIGRVIIAAIGVVGVIMALDPPGLISGMIMFSIGMTMPLFPIIVLGLYWKKATTTAAWVSVVTGMIAIWYTYMVLGVGGTYYGALAMVVSTITMVVVSLITYKPEEENKKFYQDLEAGIHEIFDIDPAVK